VRQVFLNQGSITLKEVCEPILEDDFVLISVYHSLLVPEVERPIIAQNKKPLVSHIPQKIKNIFATLSSKNVAGFNAFAKKNISPNILPLGSSCTGKVVAVGKNVTEFRSGDFVACTGTNFAHHADIICVPKYFVSKVNNKSKLQEASFVAVGTYALHVVQKAKLHLGEYVCVVGLDLIGQITLQLAKLSGCKVIAIDTNEDLLKKAHDINNVITLNPNTDDLEQEINYITHNKGIQCTFVTKEINNLMQQVISFSKHNSKIILSTHYKKSCFYQYTHTKEINFIHIPTFSEYYDQTSYSNNKNNTAAHHKKMDMFVAFLEEGTIKTKPLISHAIHIEKNEQAYEKIAEKHVTSVVFNYLPKPTALVKAEKKKQTFFPAYKNKNIKIGILGYESVEDDNLAPILKRVKNAQVEVVSNKQIASAIHLSNLYGAQKSTVHEQSLFNDPAIDVIFINASDQMHHEKTIKAIENKKAIFLENPLATTFEQLKITQDILEHTPVPFCINYHRSFAPFIKKTKQFIQKRSSPAIISYRMNSSANKQATKAAATTGILTNEAYHIFDLFLFLIDSQPISISVEAVKPTNNLIFPTNNFNAQVSFADGSICTLTYTSLGHPAMGKERMEIFYDSKSIVMDDYISLEGFGLPMTFNEQVSKPNRGQEALINNFLRELKTKIYTAPIPFERIKRATRLALIADELAIKGGGEYNDLSLVK
jgi:predicted dehydrogenase/threonine dehydrogenase-like Zn-dependent dehydrogenase